MKLLCSTSNTMMNFTCIAKETNHKSVPHLKSSEVVYNLALSLILSLSLLLMYVPPRMALGEMPWHLKVSPVCQGNQKHCKKFFSYCSKSTLRPCSVFLSSRMDIQGFVKVTCYLYWLHLWFSKYGSSPEALAVPGNLLDAFY